ncbi:SDR family NAD(P)-dependent oxidoreductase [Crenobacter intestini]|uniref:SDR family oxidoreductase n=1 Tax=Crenobacter intestini TaxID=2563443 RepID=A0A4T0UMX1_9NEIS|nr:SDR family oxidoreductase [Crenobacter intestini]TIC79811.1 SDR family oxidoreductase [Crenobacter intestini]
MNAAPVVLITGASRGIGRATALAFARAGWRVAIAARTQNPGERHAHALTGRDGAPLAGSLAETAQVIEEIGGEVLAVPMDLLDIASVDAALDAVLARFGRIDALVNNAIYQSASLNAAFLDIDDDEWQRVFTGYVRAPYRLTRRALELMLSQGTGVIVNVSSGAGESDPPIPAAKGGWGYAYGAGKGAFSRMAGVIATEHQGSGVRAYTVNPGVVATEALKATIGDNGELARRLGAADPALPAAVILMLAEDDTAGALQKRTVQVPDYQLDDAGRVVLA